MFLEGTKTTPDFENEDVDLENLEEAKYERSGEAAEEQTDSAENDINLDI